MLAKPYPPPRSRAVTVRNRTGMKLVVESFFEEAAKAVASQIADKLDLTKSESQDKADELAAALVLDWQGLAEDVEPFLAAVAVAAGQLALEQLAEDAYERFGEGMRVRAADYARDRSAEMVGRRWVDGILVDNPNAFWRIDESTRSMLRGYIRDAIDDGDSVQDLATRIENSFAFSSERAIVVARTEIAKADSEGAIAGWKATGAVKRKSWLTTGDDKVSDPCRANEAQGVVDLDWDYGQGVLAPPQHPNCRCTLLPELEELDEL